MTFFGRRGNRRRRDRPRARELYAIVFGGAAVAYAAFVGLAFARATELVHSSPLLAVAATFYGLALAVLVALPISRIVATPAIDRDHDARFWRFVRDHTAPDEVVR